MDEQLQGHRLAGADPIAALLPHRLDLLLNLSASPFGQEKVALRQTLASRAARRLGCPVVYVNQVGGNDELVFDGVSFVVDGEGTLVARLPCAREALGFWDAARDQATAIAPLPERLEQIFRVLVLGVRDYASKCGFQRALLGLSGGIDSALVAVIAAAALGPEQVRVLRMPSPWSSAGSLSDAAALTERLNLPSSTLPIAALMDSFDTALTPALGEAPRGITAENLQSRIRGTLLMALANQEGRLLLSTGNKSELAVGYCTLYGDMNGGLAVIGDLYKSTVFALCAWLDSPAAGPCRRELGLPEGGELVGSGHPRQAPQRRAAARPARQRFPAGLRRARSAAEGLHRRAAHPRAADRGRHRCRPGRTGASAAATGRIQAAPGRTTAESERSGLRQRLADADRRTLIPSRKRGSSAPAPPIWCKPCSGS